MVASSSTTTSSDFLPAIASGAPDFLLEILGDFHLESRGKLQELSETLSRQNFPSSTDLLHQLSGSSGTLGLIDFHEKTKTCETPCLNGDHPGDIMQELSTLLDESVDRARQFLELAP